tara:strand:+ start:537 stop:1049 length:513 start_codon:yes stop_codon:yes gene_type:complete
MKNRIIYFFISFILIVIFIVLYRGLSKSKFYEPKSEIKNIPEFSTITFQNEEIESKNIFNENKFYLMNIWSSWCVPCKQEHPILLSLSLNSQMVIIGLNYKDNINNSKKFLNELGNPYDMILLDKDGTISIEWGAYGVPETFLIYKGKILKRFIGPINNETAQEIRKYLK